jgi:hypothetical protein
VPRVEHEPDADPPPADEPAAHDDGPAAAHDDAPAADEPDGIRRDDAGERAAELAGLVDELEQLEADLEALATEVAAVDATRDLR